MIRRGTALNRPLSGKITSKISQKCIVKSIRLLEKNSPLTILEIIVKLLQTSNWMPKFSEQAYPSDLDGSLIIMKLTRDEPKE